MKERTIERMKERKAKRKKIKLVIKRKKRNEENQSIY